MPKKHSFIFSSLKKFSITLFIIILLIACVYATLPKPIPTTKHPFLGIVELPTKQQSLQQPPSTQLALPPTPPSTKQKQATSEFNGVSGTTFSDDGSNQPSQSEAQSGKVIPINPNQDPPEVKAVTEAKADHYQQTLQRFQLIYTQTITPSLDLAWLDHIATIPPTAPPAEWAYGLIQFPYPFDMDARHQLESAGAKFFGNLGASAMSVRLNRDVLPTLQTLAEAKRVLYGGPLPPQTKIETDLKTVIETTPTQTIATTILFFEPPTATQLEFLSHYITIDSNFLDQHRPGVQATIQAAFIPLISRLPVVSAIRVRKGGTVAMFQSRMSTGLDHLRYQNPLSSTGKGIIVAVIDTGLMEDPTYHPALSTTRIIDEETYYPNRDDNAADDPLAEETYGHGTHVAGIIGGFEADRPYRDLQGYAPEASLAIYKVCCDYTGKGFYYNEFALSIDRAGEQGAVIANISLYTDESKDVYDAHAILADEVVQGTFNPPMNVVVAAGNSHPEIPSPAKARNVITVGAIKDGGNPYEQVSNCQGGDEDNWPPGDLLCFSDCGPLDSDKDNETRLGIDLVAPGGMVKATIPYTDATQRYGQKSGTSQAAPAVSGSIAALLSHYTKYAPWLIEWPEVVKALLIATASDIGTDPTCYGYGLINSYNAAYTQPDITGPTRFLGEVITASGVKLVFTKTIPVDYHTVRVALAWADPPVEIVEGDVVDEIVHDLDLWVYDNPECNAPSIGASTSFDDSVEFVEIPAGQAGGDWCFQVRSNSLTAPQRFGLAIHPILKGPAIELWSYMFNPPKPLPGETFFLYDDIANLGYAAAASYIQLELPPDFNVVETWVYSADNLWHHYAEDSILNQNNRWFIATGSLIKNSTQDVHWHIQAWGDLGQTYTMTSTVFYKEKGILTMGAVSTKTITLASSGMYIPSLIK